MRHGFEGHYGECLAGFLLIPTLDLFVITDSEVHDFHKRLRQVFVAALGVAFALLLLAI